MLRRILSLLAGTLCVVMLAGSPALAADSGDSAFRVNFTPGDTPGSFSASIAGVPGDVSAVTCTVWCSLADVRNYSAVRTSDNTWQISVSSAEHGFRAGTYQLVAWTGTSNDTRKVFGRSATEVTYGSGALIAQPADEGMSRISLRLVGADLPERCPVWFRAWPADNPDDFRFYFGYAQNDGSYAGTMLPSRHGLAGSYVVTAYAGSAPVAWTRVELPGCSSGSMETETTDEITGAFRIRAGAEAPSGVNAVTAVVWAAPDRSDLVSYEMSEENGWWTADVSPAGHGGRAGTYSIEVYADLGSGLRALAASGTHECVPVRQMSAEYAEDGSCTVVMLGTGLAPGTTINLPTWTEEGGQDDVFWYAAQVDEQGAVRCTVDPSLHSAAVPAMRTQFLCGDEVLGELSYGVRGVVPLSAARFELNRARRAVYDEVGYDLRSVYMWTVDNIHYVPRDWQPNPPAGYSGREEWFAVEGFRTHEGDCFVYTAVFAELARGLGYDARYVEGYVWSTRGLWADHGFVVVYQDGKTYICDPELQSASSKPRDLFMQPSDKALAKYKW